MVISARGPARGEHQPSSWQALLPLLNDRPLPVSAGDTLSLSMSIELAAAVHTPPRYTAEAVVGLEEDAALVEEAQRLLVETGADNVVMLEGRLAEGAPGHGPYDVIVLEGAVEHLPAAITDQLKDGGRIACLFSEGPLGVVRIGYRIDGQMTWRHGFNAGAPVLPGFEKRAAFTL